MMKSKNRLGERDSNWRGDTADRAEMSEDDADGDEEEDDEMTDDTGPEVTLSMERARTRILCRRRRCSRRRRRHRHRLMVSALVDD